MIHPQQFYLVTLDLYLTTLDKILVKVTNPPIDSLRENKVMSLKTRFGNLGNILDFDNLTQEDIYVLDSPILLNSQLKKFKKIFSHKTKTIDCFWTR